MKYIHPPFTGFPLAALTFLLVFELLCIFSPKFRSYFSQNMAYRMFLIGLYLSSVIITFVTGYIGYDQLLVATELNEIVISKVAEHYSYAKFSLIIILPLVLFGFLSSKMKDQNCCIRCLFIIFLVLNYLIILLAGSHGGDLVLVPEYANAIIFDPRLEHELP